MTAREMDIDELAACYSPRMRVWNLSMRMHNAYDYGFMSDE